MFRRDGNREILLPLAFRRSNNALLLSGNHVLLRTDLSERLPIVQGDSVQLQQVLLNLILNAADALADVIDRPRELTIVTRPEAGGVRVEVKDNGVGIEKEKLESIFQPFYTTKTNGMGLGRLILRQEEIDAVKLPSKTVFRRDGNREILLPLAYRSHNQPAPPLDVTRTVRKSSSAAWPIVQCFPSRRYFAPEQKRSRRFAAATRLRVRLP